MGFQSQSYFIGHFEVLQSRSPLSLTLMACKFCSLMILLATLLDSHGLHVCNPQCLVIMFAILFYCHGLLYVSCLQLSMFGQSHAPTFSLFCLPLMFTLRVCHQEDFSYTLLEVWA